MNKNKKLMPQKISKLVLHKIMLVIFIIFNPLDTSAPQSMPYVPKPLAPPTQSTPDLQAAPAPSPKE